MNKKTGIASICFCLLLPLHVLALPTPGSGGHKALRSSIIEAFKQYDGQITSRISFQGLTRTREQALLWIMQTKTGEKFSAEQLAKDVQTLENTGVLYEVVPDVKPSATFTGQLDVSVSLKDKWTLLPVAGSQGGGGALTYGGGLVESNLLGWLIYSQGFVYNYNGDMSYDLHAEQEYVAGTQTMAFADWSNNINPTIIHKLDGTSAGDFTWRRQQEEVMIGTHLGGQIRPMLISDLYYDNVMSSSGVNVSTFSGTQYRFQPQVIFGRADIIEFLEDGTEFTIRGTIANPFGPVQAYQGVDLSLKKVMVLPGRANLAFLIYGGVTSVTSAPYELEVGGYYNLRGYIDSRQVGPYSTHSTLEYRPLLFTYRFPLPEIDLVAVQACVFSDFGAAWGDPKLTGELNTRFFNPLWSAGLGLRFNFLHFAGAIIRVDVARTIQPDEGLGLSFGVGQFF